MFLLRPKSSEYSQISKLLFRDSLRFIGHNKDLLTIPFIYAFIEICAFSIVLVLIFFSYKAGKLDYLIAIISHSYPKSSPIYLVIAAIVVISACIFALFIALINNMMNATVMYIVTKRISGQPASLVKGFRAVLPYIYNIFFYEIIYTFTIRLRSFRRQRPSQRDIDNINILSFMINIGCIFYGYKLFVIQTMLFNNKTPKEAAREIFEFYTKESIKINAFYSYAAWALRFINFSCLIPFLLLFAGIYLVYLSQNTHLINYFFIIFCIGYFVVFFLLAQFIYVVANPILNAIEWTIIYNCLQNKSIPTKFFSNELGQRLTSAP